MSQGKAAKQKIPNGGSFKGIRNCQSRWFFHRLEAMADLLPPEPAGKPPVVGKDRGGTLAATAVPATSAHCQRGLQHRPKNRAPSSELYFKPLPARFLVGLS